MIRFHSDHFQWKDLYYPLMGQPKVFSSQCGVTSSFEANHLTHCQSTRTEYWPNFLLVKHLFLLNSLLDLLLEGVVEVFIEEGYLIKSGAEGVFELGVGSFQEEDVFVLLGKLLREVYECLLIGLLVGKGVFFDEMKPAVWSLTHDRAIRDFPDC